VARPQRDADRRLSTRGMDIRTRCVAPRMPNAPGRIPGASGSQFGRDYHAGWMDRVSASRESEPAWARTPMMATRRAAMKSSMGVSCASGLIRAIEGDLL